MVKQRIFMLLALLLFSTTAFTEDFQPAQDSILSENFRLEATVEGGPYLYPGQKANFIYRILFKRDIDLAQQYLPLMDLEGFRKIGDKVVISYRSGEWTVQEIKQHVEAVEPGEYRVAASFIEGDAYQEDFMGRKIFLKPRLKAVAPALEMEILPFPAVGQPESFNGAIGNFKLDIRMITPSKVGVEDKVKLAVSIVGDGELTTIQFPRLSLQPQFIDEFRLNDLPPEEQEIEKGKRFIVELRPLSSNVTEVPVLSFAFFNPIERKYQVLRSQAIPLTVSELNPALEVVRGGKAEKTDEESSFVIKETKKEDPSQKEGLWRKSYENLDPIEISGNYILHSEDFVRPGMRNFLPYILIGICILIFQEGVYRWREQKRRCPKQNNSRDLYKLALGSKKEPKLFFSYIEKSLLLRLREVHELSEGVSSLSDLSSQGHQGRVLKFCLSIEEARFAAGGRVSKKKIGKEARALLKSIRKSD